MALISNFKINVASDSVTIRDNLNRTLYNVSSLSSDGKKIFAVKDENNFETLRLCVNTGYSPFSPLKIVTVSTGGQTIGVIEHSINICALKFQTDIYDSRSYKLFSVEKIFDSPFSSENFKFFIKDDENWEEVCKISATDCD